LSRQVAGRSVDQARGMLRRRRLDSEDSARSEQAGSGCSALRPAFRVRTRADEVYLLGPARRAIALRLENGDDRRIHEREDPTGRHVPDSRSSGGGDPFAPRWCVGLLRARPSALFLLWRVALRTIRGRSQADSQAEGRDPSPASKRPDSSGLFVSTGMSPHSGVTPQRGSG